MVKIVGEKRYGELLGGHICAAKAADLIQELVNAHELEGGFAEVARTIRPGDGRVAYPRAARLARTSLISSCRFSGSVGDA